MTDGVETQRTAFEETYGASGRTRWAFHYTDDPLTRYLRDRRLKTALRTLEALGHLDAADQSVLVVCGGVGGEGTFLRRFGFREVTVSDFSTEALELCRRFDPHLKTHLLDAEQMDLPASSYDIVLVQDGLHHLPRPVLGFTEMLRVAREAVVVIEPHEGLVGRMIGTEWEIQGEAVNYVFRWNRGFLEQCTRSYLLSKDVKVVVNRLWDHNSVVAKLVSRLVPPLRLSAARLVYAALRPVASAGNMMVGVIIKHG